MRRVPFDPRTLDAAQQKWLADWKIKAVAETAATIKAWNDKKEVKFKSQLWGDLKAWLLPNVFAGKCAYCETAISGAFFGEGEHYRPKGKVTVRVNPGARKQAVAVGGAGHGGYFWLAYDVENLLPACQECNNRKSDMFPVAAQHVWQPNPDSASLNTSEQPLLLHPYYDDPRQYLRFGLNGVVAAKDGSMRGIKTIETFGLDRAELETRRARRQEEVLAFMNRIIPEVLADKITLQSALDSYVGFEAEFSVAARDIVAAELPKLIQRLTSIEI